MPFCLIAAVWNTFLLCVLFSPYEFPVSAQTFNFSSGQCFSACACNGSRAPVPCADRWFPGTGAVIFGAVTIFGIVSWAVIPNEQWLSRRALATMIHPHQPDAKDAGEGSTLDAAVDTAPAAKSAHKID